MLLMYLSRDQAIPIHLIRSPRNLKNEVLIDKYFIFLANGTRKGKWKIVLLWDDMLFYYYETKISHCDVLFTKVPGKWSIYWEYQNPKDDLRSLTLVPGRSKLHIVIPGFCIFNCSYGSERNKANKRVWQEKKICEKDVNLSHIFSEIDYTPRPLGGLSSMNLYEGDFYIG